MNLRIAIVVVVIEGFTRESSAPQKNAHPSQSLGLGWKSVCTSLGPFMGARRGRFFT